MIREETGLAVVPLCGAPDLAVRQDLETGASPAVHILADPLNPIRGLLCGSGPHFAELPLVQHLAARNNRIPRVLVHARLGVFIVTILFFSAIQIPVDGPR